MPLPREALQDPFLGALQDSTPVLLTPGYGMLIHRIGLIREQTRTRCLDSAWGIFADSDCDDAWFTAAFEKCLELCACI